MIVVPFFKSHLKNFLFKIKECFSISAYPQIICFFGNDFKNDISLITKSG